MGRTPPTPPLPWAAGESRARSLAGPSRGDALQRRRLPVGAEPLERGVHFRVWAPGRRVEAVLEGGPGAGRTVPLEEEPRGYHSGWAAGAGAGTRYRFRLDGEDALLPDPASRYQPEGPHGPSEVVDPSTFAWTDHAWRGVGPDGQVIYEMHVGTLTAEGTWEAAGRELQRLRDLGITLVEVMPVAEFPGRFGWGYDGVAPFAPFHGYGAPDDMRRFVDLAHSIGLGVVLDVVYNHLGPDGAYQGRFSPHYYTRRYHNDWGQALNFDGPRSAPVREYFAANAVYWVEEMHVDGLRLDATQDIQDASPEHVVALIARRARAAAGKRTLFLSAEDEPQRALLLRPAEAGGFGLDAAWNDDFHHTARVAATCRREAYFQDYGGTPQELLSALKRGWLYQGQRYAWQRKRRGSPSRGLPPARFVTYLQNHDQVANTPGSLRLHQLSPPGTYRALTALLLLGPGTPLLFQGQEFAASSPFPYFADHEPGLAAAVRKGRDEFLKQFLSQALPECQAAGLDPADHGTFAIAKLDPAERGRNARAVELHRDLLHLRREDPVLRGQGREGLDGAVLGPEALVLRFFADDGADRLLLVNLGCDLELTRAPEPLLGPTEGAAGWETRWSSEALRYGGTGALPLEGEDGSWRLPGRAAALLVPRMSEEAQR